MYAIVRSGGKQHKVSPGDIIKVESLAGESGAKIQLSDVLLLNDGKKTQVGSPFVAKATISATILEQTRDKKIIVFKKKRRQGYRRKHGHRQHLTVLKIDAIQGDGVSAKAEAKSAKAPAKPAAKLAAKAETKPAAKAPVKAATKKPAPKASTATKAKTAAKPKTTTTKPKTKS